MPAEHQEVRKKLEDAIRRAEQDEGYAAELRRDPASVLKEAGIEGVSADVLAGRAPADERLLPYLRCNDYTCWSSDCPGTCVVTVCHSTYWW